MTAGDGARQDPAGVGRAGDRRVGHDSQLDGMPMAAFESLGDQTVHQGHVITLVNSRFRAPDGTVIERDVVRHPGAVSVVPLWDNGDITLVSQFRAPFGRNMVEIPAGMRDVAGETPEACAHRELKEEIGVVADHMERLVVFNNSVGFTDEQGTIFLATGLHAGEREAYGVEELHMTSMRVPLTEALAMIENQMITDAKTIIGLTLTAGRVDRR